ncbi:hypothetical protein Tco_1123998 [Tanacetum coccineum]|uniref:Uncharacterized protein n=1 Tax=Tanacetum coccineum TaxID=301880 RepID=A0ABQ5J4X9_9ASTR
MDESDLTMEEYIEFQAEKAQRRGQTFTWETATYRKVYCDDLDSFTDFEIDFPAIVYNDAYASSQNVSSEPTVSIYNEIKADIDFSISFSNSEDDDYTVICDKDSFSFKIIHVSDLKPELVDEHVKINTESCSENIDIKPMESVTYVSKDITPIEFNENLETNHDDKSKPLKANNFILIVLDFRGLTDEMAEGLSGRMVMEHRDAQEEMESVGFGGVDIDSVSIPYLLAQYLRRLSLERKQGAMISEGQFVARLLQICEELDVTWAWVVLGPERQHDIAVGAPEVAGGAFVVDEGALAIPAPVQAPQPPPTAAQTRTMPQRMARLEEKVHGIRESLAKQLEVMDAMAKDFSRFIVWAASGISQLLDLSGVTYTRYSETRVPYQRRGVRHRTDDASTSAAPQ